MNKVMLILPDIKDPAVRNALDEIVRQTNAVFEKFENDINKLKAGEINAGK